MLKSMGDLTGAVFSLILAILWGTMASYLQNSGIAPGYAIYALWALCVVALVSAGLGLLRASAKARQSTAGQSLAGDRRARESEAELVERMLARLNAESGTARDQAPVQPTGSQIRVETEDDEIVARVLRKLEADKAAREAAGKD